MATLVPLARAGCAVLALAACGNREARLAPEPDDPQVGYGTRPREQMAGSVSSLAGAELNAHQVARVEEMIRGRIPGVEVLRGRDGELSLRIRGMSSFGGDSEPLCIIDGVPVDGSLTSALAGLLPQDIARIDVIKDATASIYGSRGANGVILIKTKRR